MTQYASPIQIPSPVHTKRPLLKSAAILIIVLVFFWIASSFKGIIFMILASVAITMVLRPAVNYAHVQFGIQKGLAVLIVFLVIGGISTLASYAAFQTIITGLKDMYALFQNFPFEEKLTATAQSLSQNLPFIKVDQLTEWTHKIITIAVNSIGEIVNDVVLFVLSFTGALFIAVYLLIDGDRMSKQLVERVPNRYFEMFLNVTYKIRVQLGGYIRGLLMESASVGALMVIGFYALGIHYPVAAGAIAGFCNLIPYFGPLIGSFVALIISMTQFGDFRMLVPITLLTIIVQMIDDTLLRPNFFGRVIHIHPMMVILVILAGKELLGVAGMVLSIPLFIILRVTFVETYWGLKHYRIETPPPAQPVR